MKRSVELLLSFLGIFLCLANALGIVYNIEAVMKLIIVLNFYGAILFAILTSDLLFKKEKNKQVKKIKYLKVIYAIKGTDHDVFFNHTFRVQDDLISCVREALAFEKDWHCSIASMQMLTTEE